MGTAASSAKLSVILLALLGANVAVYALTGRTSEILDATAWLLLLAAFALASFAPAVAQRWRNTLVLLRLIAAGVVLWAALQFVAEHEWLDALNAWLWIAVVIALEIELRAAASRRWPRIIARLLLTALLLPALLWLMSGDWFEAYDALLWIGAFALVERGFDAPADHTMDKL